MEVETYEYGDVILYNGNEYVFLTFNEDSIYLARILSLSETATLNRIDGKITDSSPHANRTLLVYFITLKTKEFRDRAVCYGRTQFPFGMFTKKLNISLNVEDLKTLKKEILSSSVATGILKEAIKKIKFSWKNKRA